jgi:hypothetical protein
MKIPENVSHRAFWEAAKVKGIKISSKYVGVYLSINTNGSPSWMARVQGLNGKLLSFKRFPFTEKGEIDAARFYEMKKSDSNDI